MALIRSQSCQTSTNIKIPRRFWDQEISLAWGRKVVKLGNEASLPYLLHQPDFVNASVIITFPFMDWAWVIMHLHSHWVSLAFKIVLNFPRASRTPQAPYHLIRVTHPRPSLCFPPPTFLLCNDSITSSHVTTTSQSQPGMMRYWPIRGRHCTGIISPRLTDTALDLITLAKF